MLSSHPAQPAQGSQAAQGGQAQDAPPRHSAGSLNNSAPPQPEPPQALARHINRPLRFHVWSSVGRFWTRAELDQERTDFFDTRVAEHKEIWQAIHTALAVLWTGGEGVDDDEGLATAQQILAAAEITVPSGDLVDGAYDSLGAFYALPEPIVSDPVNMMPEYLTEGDDQEEEREGADEEPIAELTKVINAEDRIAITARRSDGVIDDLVIVASRKDSVQVLALRFIEASQVSLLFDGAKFFISNSLQAPAIKVS